MPCDAQSLYDWHARPGAFSRLSPPWRPVCLKSGGETIDAGSELRIASRLGVFPIVWDARIESNEPGASFVDVQTRGPFESWRHSHCFEESGPSDSVLVDRVDYRLKGGPLGSMLGSRLARRELERLFSYRHALTRRDLGIWSRYRDSERWRILIVGGSGFIGSRLKSFLETQGHHASILSRRSGDGRIQWNPLEGKIDRASLEGFDVVVNLAGRNLADGRWIERRKREIWSSRVESSRFLINTLSSLEQPPKCYASASGIGVYGNSGEKEMGESDSVGNGFLAELCEAWEAEAASASNFCERILMLRTGVVIDASDGALAKMRAPFVWGLGGPIGSGRQWMPWIGLEDWMGGLYFALREDLEGPINLVAPNPSRNEEFARVLGSILGRPSRLPVPEWALNALLGEFAQEALLSSCRAIPERLLAEGYEFGFSDLEDCLRFTLGKTLGRTAVSEH